MLQYAIGKVWLHFTPGVFLTPERKPCDDIQAVNHGNISCIEHRFPIKGFNWAVLIPVYFFQGGSVTGIDGQIPWT